MVGWYEYDNIPAVFSRYIISKIYRDVGKISSGSRHNWYVIPINSHRDANFIASILHCSLVIKDVLEVIFDFFVRISLLSSV